VGGVGDPEFGAVQDVAIALLFGTGAHRHDVGTRSGLGHGQRADMFAADQLGQIFLLLLGRAPAPDLVDAQVGVGAVAQADRGRGARHFLHRHDMFEIAQAKAAELFLDGDSVQAQFAHLGPELAFEFVLFVDLGGQRGQAIGGPAGGGVADGVGVIAKAEFHGLGREGNAHALGRSIAHGLSPSAVRRGQPVPSADSSCSPTPPGRRRRPGSGPRRPWRCRCCSISTRGERRPWRRRGTGRLGRP
jgi:hypothetical protein